MTQIEQLASFVVNSSHDDLSAAAVQALKGRILDALGCALGALDAEMMRLLAAQLDEFGGASLSTLIGGGRTAPDRAALFNGALVRYLDFNDSYLAPGETCHPSDNLGAVLAAAEFAGYSGKEFLTALATAYQVQCRLSDVAPVRARGFDHTTQGSYAIAAGVSRALGLDESRTAHALAICGTAFNALRFEVAYHIIGGGEEGDKTVVRTKEQADHSLPYLVAVALLDGQVMPEQFRSERIDRRDVQELLQKVVVRPVDAYSRQFPERMPCRVTITLADGRVLAREKQDYEGFHTRPMPWPMIVRKFDRLSAPFADPSLRAAIVEAVTVLETIRISKLSELLSKARGKEPTG